MGVYILRDLAGARFSTAVAVASSTGCGGEFSDEGIGLSGANAGGID